jgi:hypothetical protein
MAEMDDEELPDKDPRCMIGGETDKTLNNIRRASDHKTIGYICSDCEANLLTAAGVKVNLRMYLMLKGWRCVRWYGIEAWTHRTLQTSTDPVPLGEAAKLQISNDLGKQGY